jgi:hypothetical protein
MILVNCNVNTCDEVTIEKPKQAKPTKSHKSSTSSFHFDVFTDLALSIHTHTAPPMSIPTNSGGAQIIISRRGPFLPQTSAAQLSKPNPTSFLSNLIKLLKFRFSSIKLPISQGSSSWSLVRRASSLLGPCYTSTRSHLEDVAIRVAAL